MVRKKLIVVLAGLAMVLSMASQAFADCRTKIDLPDTALGAATDASGTAEVRARTRDGFVRQRFKVSMDARVADGTVFAVFVDDQLAGTITIVLGDGELELNNNNDKILPTAVDPVCSIKTVEVRNGGGMTLLQGSF
ncbi:MAG: hypothetical protein ACE5IP_01745 [Terriglobia bacterium]